MKVNDVIKVGLWFSANFLVSVEVNGRGKWTDRANKLCLRCFDTHNTSKNRVNFDRQAIKILRHSKVHLWYRIHLEDFLFRTA